MQKILMTAFLAFVLSSAAQARTAASGFGNCQYSRVTIAKVCKLMKADECGDKTFMSRCLATCAEGEYFSGYISDVTGQCPAGLDCLRSAPVSGFCANIKPEPYCPQFGGPCPPKDSAGGVDLTKPPFTDF